ncbi:MAG TPA: GNAT family N-acetyltransferase [Candidatus Limnocylindrales bacterium]|nr:GNAT family N-acetyltransferase [Candidatus Limnocylindrales bacterium]
MPDVRIVDVTDDASFALVPPCADPGFDHRSCDYWEDAERGSKAARAAWLEAPAPPVNPFRPESEPAFNPFAPASRAATSGPTSNPFAGGDDDPLADNPFAPRRPARPQVDRDAPRKLALLGRGLAIFGSYAKLLVVDDEAVGYTQFGPLSAYPRALRLRELYPQLPQSPLPAVITCIATTKETRGRGHARRLVEAVCDDLADRGFAAVETYPERGARPDATSAASPVFWLSAGFAIAVDDDRYPVLRREL